MVAKSNTERSHWKQIDYRYMTEESSDEDGNFKSHHHSWHSKSIAMHLSLLNDWS